ncbi:MAG: class I SAM-dependent methyltransferase [Spirochaetaceae bacterium]|nr:class I SAM-dependent methyltransferase [Spirochaetaceae bacterium]
MLANRLVKRQKHLGKWARRRRINAYRLYDRDIPEIPLVLDWYNGAVSGALYKRPYEKDPGEEEQWLEAMRQGTARALGINPSRIFIKFREPQRGKAQYHKTGAGEFLTEVSEDQMRFRVNLSGYLDTGLFLDRRLLRVRIRKEAAGRRVLNLFSYTGAFSVCAAAGGAALVDSVDLSNTYLDWARENFLLNGPLLADGNCNCRFIREDVLRFLDGAAGENRKWDLIILDPPAFSNSKKMALSFDLRRDHRELLAKCFRVLEGGGTLYLSANVHRFKLELPAGGRTGNIVPEDISEGLRDEDYRGRRIPAAYRIRLPG